MSAVDPRKIRRPAVVGRFYPGDPLELRKLITTFLENAAPATGVAPKAVIAPHAGYPYSGPIAASAYAQFTPARGSIKRVVVLGPSHYVAVEGLAASSAEYFSTPLGLVSVDIEAVRKLASLPQVVTLDEAHVAEHSVEAQLPFLQVVLEDFKLVPLVVGEASMEEFGQVLDALWDGAETRFVISSDLSHYHDFETAQALDRTTADAIEALRPEGISGDQACGRVPIRGLLEVARRRGLRARTVDLRSSGDTAGPRGRVVGYGAFVFEEQAEPRNRRNTRK